MPLRPLIQKTPNARARDITGFRTHMLQAVSRAGADGRRNYWNVRCDCGKMLQMTVAQLEKSGNRSCGCARRRLIGNAARKHGMTQHPVYWVWRSMRDRCRLPTHQSWKNYGARGITVCPRWENSFEAFWEDVQDGYQTGLDFDRIDNSKGYEPGNVRWTTRQMNTRHTRHNRVIDTPKGKMLLCEAADITGIGKTTLLYRHQSGCPPERMFDKPNAANRYSTS